MLLSELPTPAVLVDVHRLEANLDAMQAHAEAQGVTLRPHTKTHKSVDMARRQVGKGASGLTVAKTGEAEVFADAGFDDIRLAYALVGTDKFERIAALQARGCRMSFCVDTGAGARAASEYFKGAAQPVEVMIETDIGYGRCGVRWDHEESIRFAAWVDTLPGLRVSGILTHAGHAYFGPQSPEESLFRALERVSNQERDRMLEFAVSLREAGVRAAVDGSLEISIGSTPSIRAFTNRVHEGFQVTEIRPGNYLYLDMTQVNLGVASLDACSLTVLASVISAHDNVDGSRRFFLDAGKKVLTSDGAYGSKGYGQILSSWNPQQPMTDTVINALSEEHGWVRTTGTHAVAVGERVRVVPNHACVVVNTQQSLFLVDGDRVVGRVHVDGQSRVV